MVYVVVSIKTNKKHYFWRNLHRFTEKATSPKELNFIPQWIKISWSSMDKNEMQDINGWNETKMQWTTHSSLQLSTKNRITQQSNSSIFLYLVGIG